MIDPLRDGREGLGDAVPPGGPGRRPLVERLGLAMIAFVVALLFAGIALASASAGELFLAAMAGIGAVMTAWAGARTLVRG